jgi:hypothetical protein
MFAIHGKVELLKRDGRALGTYARHYYDLFQLASQDEVLDMLRSDEYGEIKRDYDQISRTYFPNSYFYPAAMSFANSDALFAAGDLSTAIEREYEGQCQILCFGPYPSWATVQARLVELRELL